MEGVYDGGDIVLGAATVIQAMGQGRIAAEAINRYLAQKKQNFEKIPRKTKDPPNKLGG